MICHDYTKLHNQTGGSNKYYEAQVVEIEPGAYATIARFGRIESFPRGQEVIKKVVGTLNAAQREFTDLVRKKLGKTYEIVDDGRQDVPLFVQSLMLHEDVKRATADIVRVRAEQAEARAEALRSVRPFDNSNPLFG